MGRGEPSVHKIKGKEGLLLFFFTSTILPNFSHHPYNPPKPFFFFLHNSCKFVTIFSNCQNFLNLSKLSQIVTTFSNCQNFLKLSQLSQLVKTFSNCHNFLKLSQLSQTSQHPHNLKGEASSPFFNFPHPKLEIQRPQHSL